LGAADIAIRRLLVPGDLDAAPSPLCEGGRGMAPIEEAEIEVDTPVTTVIRQHPRADAVERYERWLKEIIPVAQSFAGHQSVNVIRPHGPSDAYTIVLHFDSEANLRRWLDSDVRGNLLAKIRPDLRAAEAIDIKAGIEFWFTPPPAGKPARAYKQFLVTLSAIFPLSMIVPLVFQPVFTWSPLLGAPGMRHLIVAAAIVALMVWVIMPRYTRAVAKWLFG
jgi:hypothetical protein